MMCVRCKIEMKSGTSYENKGDKPLARRFYKCIKCHNKVYSKKPNFQECMRNASEKCRNI